MRMNGINKSKDNAVIFGVLGGLGEYFNVDPVLLRVIVVVAGFLTGGFPVIVLYLLLALIIPEEPKGGYEKRRHRRKDGNSYRRSYESKHQGRKKHNRSERKDLEDTAEDDWSDF